MAMKKIIVLAPALPRWQEVNAIKKSLSFLENEYSLVFLDPLVDAIKNSEKVNDFSLWEKRIGKELDHCVALIGFSLGGIILRRCFNFLEKLNKKIILISSPEKINASLINQLKKIINHANKGEVNLAIEEHSKSIFFPSSPLKKRIKPKDKEIICKRLSIGLKIVLDKDNYSDEHKNISDDWVLLVGEKSKLVNIKHITYQEKKCIIIPNAGMRILQDNPVFCQSIIKEALREIK
jgi:hypothetical protein